MIGWLLFGLGISVLIIGIRLLLQNNNREMLLMFPIYMACILFVVGFALIYPVIYFGWW